MTTGYCREHKREAVRYKAGTRQERGYGAAWQRIRQQVLERDNYLCQPCIPRDTLTEAKQVDHVIPKAQGGTDDPENLQAICDKCHKAKTAQEGGGARGNGQNG